MIGPTEPAQDRAGLLALTPDVYLRDGYLGPGGAARPELHGLWATAAAEQLLAAEASPQEAAMLLAAVRQALPLHEDGAAPDRLAAALDEASGLVASATRQEGNAGLARWIAACASCVGMDADLPAFLAHVQAVTRQYALIAALQPDQAQPGLEPLDSGVPPSGPA